MIVISKHKAESQCHSYQTFIDYQEVYVRIDRSQTLAGTRNIESLK